jgi:hypothetical protein
MKIREQFPVHGVKSFTRIAVAGESGGREIRPRVELIIRRRGRRRRRRRSAIKDLRAVRIVPGALGGIGEDLVSASDLLEEDGGFFASLRGSAGLLDLVGVPLEGELAVGGADVVAAGGPVDAEHLVQASLRSFHSHREERRTKKEDEEERRRTKKKEEEEERRRICVF